MRKLYFKIMTMAIALLGFATVNAQGDDCATAQVIPTATTFMTFNADGPVTGGAGAALNCFATLGVNADWYTFTAPAGGGTVTLTSDGVTTNGEDTRLSFYDGGCGALNCVNSNDDIGFPNYASELIDVPVVGGTQYHIEWDDRWSGAAFNWDFTFAPPPACPDPTGLTFGAFTATSVDVSWIAAAGATNYMWEIQLASNPLGFAPAVASGSGAATMATAAGSYTSGTNYTLYVQSDCGGPLGNYQNTSAVAAIAPANDLCIDAIAVACGSLTPGSTTFATVEAQDDCGGAIVAQNVYYTIAPTTFGTPEQVTISTCNSTTLPLATPGTANYDSKLAVYKGTCGLPLQCIAQNDDGTDANGTGCTGFSSRLTFTTDGFTTYIVMVHGFNAFSAGDFELSVECAPACTPGATNGDCGTALAQVVDAPGLGVATQYNNVCVSQATSNPTCNLFGNIQDVWVSFVAPAVGAIEYTTSLDTATAVTSVLYSGACGALTEISCNFAAGTFISSGLTPGDTYFIQLTNEGGAEEGTFSLVIEEGPAAPANDTCNGAIGLTVNADQLCGTVTSGTTAASSPSPEAEGCGGGSDDDVWYTFTATQSTHEISLLNIVGTTTDMEFAVYYGDSICGNLGAEIACSDPESAIIGGLTNGDDYYVRVYTWSAATNSADFDICVGTPPPPPSNDECAGADPLTVFAAGGSVGFETAGNTTLATQSAQGADMSCDGGTGNLDLFYTFSTGATDTAINVITAGAVGANIEVSVWDICGGIGAGAVEFDCLNNGAGVINNLAASSTFVLQVWSDDFNAGDFTIALEQIPNTPANDEIAGAIAVACGSSTPGSTISSTQGVDEALLCGTAVTAAGVWYTIDGTTGEDITADLCGSAYDTKINIYTGTTGALTCVIGEDDDFGNCGAGNDPSVTWTGVTGTTYLILVQGFGGATGSFGLNIACNPTPTPPANDDCAGAITLPVNPDASCAMTVAGTITAATASVDAEGCGGGSDDDVWYTFTATGSVHDISILNAVGSTGDMEFAVYDGGNACGTLGAELLCSDPEVGQATGLTAGNDYYVRVFTWTATAGQTTDFDMCIGTPPPPPANDSLCASENIIVDFGTGFGDNSQATPSGALVPSCFSEGPPGTVDNDVWYDFIAPAGGEVDVNFAQITGDNQLAIFSSSDNTCNGVLTELICEDGPVVPATTNMTGLTPGDTYYIMVDGWQGNSGAFAIDISTPIPTGGFVWEGAGGDGDWNNTANWQGGVVPANGCTDDVYISALGTAPTLDAIYNIRDLSGQVGATINVPAGNALIVCGDVTLPGGFQVLGAGALALDATSGTGTMINIAGTARVDNLGLNTPYSSNGGTLEIGNALVLNATFTNVSSEVVLVSDAAGTAFLNDFDGGGTYNGDITVQRFITPGSGLGQRYIGTAVAASALSGMDATYAGGPFGQVIPFATCDPTALESFSPYSNIFEYDESLVTTCNQSGFVALDPSTPLTPGSGYSVWVNDGSVVSVTGVPVTGPVSTGPLSNTAANTVTAGWHALSNVYPSPITMASISAGGLTSPSYYIATTGPFSGTFQAVPMGSTVPVMQGFVAQSTGTESLDLVNADRVASNVATFEASGSWFTNKLDVIVSGNGFADITTLYYSDNNTSGFDALGDCVKRESDFGQPTLYTKLNGSNLNLNGYPTSDLGQSVAMGLNAGTEGTFTFEFEGLETFPANTMIYVEDLAEGVYHNTLDGAYTFEAKASGYEDRFVIHYVLPLEIAVTGTSCAGDLGTISTTSNDNRSFDLTSNGNVIASGSTANMIENVGAGAYNLSVTDNYGGTSVYTVFVLAADAVTADFTASSLDVEVDEVITFNNASSAAGLVQWTVNGETIEGIDQLTYAFSTAGTYEVIMTISTDECSDTRTYSVNVSDKSTNIQNLGSGQLISILSEANVINVEFEGFNNANAEVEVFNVLGQSLAVKIVDANGVQTVTIPNPIDGYYIVRVSAGGSSVSQKVLIAK